MTDAADPSGALYGSERVQAFFEGGAGGSAAETVERLVTAVRTFAAGAPQSDDITILALRRTAAVSGGAP